MTSFYPQPGLSRFAGWKIAAGVAAALLVIAAGAVAYATIANDGAPAWTSAATFAGAGNAPALSVGVVSGAYGAPVDVPLRIAHAQGIGSASVLLTYDPAVVTVTDVRNGDVPQSTLTWSHDEAAGAVVLLLTTSLSSGATGEHAFAFLTLEARPDATGQTSELGLALRSAADADGNAATLGATSGAFRNGVPGDVLGDGAVDWNDYHRLAAYLVGDDVRIIELNADLDGDGKVTVADALRLHQRLDGA